MSNTSESADIIKPSDGSKPVVKEKDPHNYRKVGYSMIVISVSLVLIGLLVWAIGDNYHFSSDIMAAQEITAMTPRSGFNIISFDYTQPIGSKIMLLGHTSNIDDAKKLQVEYAKKFEGEKSQALIFDASSENNTGSIAMAEVYAMTPSNGYHIVEFNSALPVGAKLSSLKQDSLLANATKDSQFYTDQIKLPEVKVVVLTNSFTDNLKQIDPKYDTTFISENVNKFIVQSNLPQTP